MESVKVVINRCFGGFGLSSQAVEEYLARKGKHVWWFKDSRDKQGHLNLRGAKVPTDNPDGEFISYAYTSPDGSDESYFYHRDIPRDDPDLVAVVEEMGDKANGTYAALAVVEIPDGVEWEIDEYDGSEHIAEQHRTWR